MNITKQNFQGGAPGWIRTSDLQLGCYSVADEIVRNYIL